MEQLQAVGVPAGPSQNTLELMDDPQLQHRNQFSRWTTRLRARA